MKENVEDPSLFIA